MVETNAMSIEMVFGEMVFGLQGLIWGARPVFIQNLWQIKGNLLLGFSNKKVVQGILDQFLAKMRFYSHVLESGKSMLHDERRMKSRKSYSGSRVKVLEQV